MTNRLDEEIPKRGGAEGGRSTVSTDEAGPKKPGNRVEEKTLRIRKGAMRAEVRQAQPYQFQTWLA